MHVVELPQSSVAVYILFIDLLQPDPDMLLREDVMVGLAVILSVAVADPSAGNAVGLQPRLDDGGQNVNVGAVVLTI